jgi:hypothetical protein
MTGNSGHDGLAAAPRLLLFGEEIALDPPFTVLLADVQQLLESIAARYGNTLADEETEAHLAVALDELDTALAGVREARWKLGRIEIRLVSAVEEAARRVRDTHAEARADTWQRNGR